LTREPTADEVDSFEVVGSAVFDVVIPRHLRPVLGEHLPAKLVLLHLPHHRAVASPFEAKFEATGQMPENNEPMVSFSDMWQPPFYAYGGY